MPYSIYLLAADHLKTPLQPNVIRLSTANHTELANRVHIDSFQLAAEFLIGFDFVTLYKVGLYWDG